MRVPHGRLTLPTTSLLAAVLALGVLVVPAHADQTDPTQPVPDAAVAEASTTDPTEAAVAALDQVESILEPTTADARTTEPATTDDGRDLTLALRDLRMRQDQLPRSDRARAAALVSRPPQSEGWADERTQRYGPVLVHWDNGTVSTSYLNQVGAVAQHVLATYAAAGYRAPESDGTIGGNGLLDIYVSDLGFGLYGYCNTDSPPPDRGPYDTPAYCSFSSDYSWASSRTPLENLKVTAAHELFHATQFAYDYEEDAWFMEATATWAEDEVYDDINDNRQYLPRSPISQPGQSLDQFISCQSCPPRQYGEWIFFRYLTERFPRSEGGMPVIMRRLWERVDAARGGPDLYSIQAVSRELAARGTSLRRAYAQFGDANRRPARAYEEGAAYPRAGAAQSWAFTTRRHDTGWQRLVVNHLATRTVQVKPSAALRARRLRVVLDLPAPTLGVAAIVTRYRTDGRTVSRFVPLSKAGGGRATVLFDARNTARIDVTLSNAGIRYARCWSGPASNGVRYSCSGVSRDDRRPMRYRISAIR